MKIKSLSAVIVTIVSLNIFAEGQLWPWQDSNCSEPAVTRAMKQLSGPTPQSFLHRLVAAFQKNNCSVQIQTHVTPLISRHVNKTTKNFTISTNAITKAITEKTE